MPVTELDDGRRRIVAQLPDNVWRELVVEARRGNEPPVQLPPVRVLRLTRPPAIVKPIWPEKRTADPVNDRDPAAAVRAEEFTVAATAIQRVDNKDVATPMQSDAENPRVFYGELRLTSGANTITVRLKNLVGKEDDEVYVVPAGCRFPSCRRPKVEVKARARTVGEATLFVDDPNAKLRVKTNDDNATLLLDGEPYSSTEPFVIDLKPLLVEGSRAS